MFSSPYRLVTALRPSVRIGILVAAAGSSIVFTATPFLITAVVEDFDVGLGLASSISTAQLAGFVLASWLGGRILTPSRRLVMLAVLGLVATNLLSAFAPNFWLLVGLRTLAGVSLGLITWIAWTEAAGSSRQMRDVAVVGPLTGAVAAPVLGLTAEAGGTGAVYALLTVVAAVPLFLPNEPSPAASEPRGPRRPAVLAAKVVLAALFLVTAGGSAVFVYAAAIALDATALGATAISLAFTANAVVSIPMTRWAGRRPLAGIGYVVAGGCALLVGDAPAGWAWFLGLTVWGAAFWYATPATHALLAARSRYPQERVGDAQAIMAAGRVLGPVIGGIAIGSGSPTLLGVVGLALLGVAGLVVIAVEVLVPAREQGDEPDAPVDHAER